MNNSSEVNWEQSIWDEINEAVVKEVAKVRTAQKVFPTMSFDTPQSTIPNDVINFADLSIQEGQTKPFVEIYLEFPLTATQVAKEAEYKTCKTLARMAAKAIALAEDHVIFQGKNGKLPGKVEENLINSADNGLLGLADSSMNKPAQFSDTNPDKISEPIKVDLIGRTGLYYAENTFKTVTRGIAKLTAKAQAPMFALFLPVEAYADTFVPINNSSLVTTAELIKPLVEGGFMETVTLPQEKGLLVALAGDPTSLYLGREATTEFVRKEGSKYFFRVVERIQFVARDPRAFVLLNFEQPKTKSSRTSSSSKTAQT